MKSGWFEIDALERRVAWSAPQPQDTCLLILEWEVIYNNMNVWRCVHDWRSSKILCSYITTRMHPWPKTVEKVETDIETQEVLRKLLLVFLKAITLALFNSLMQKHCSQHRKQILTIRKLIFRCATRALYVEELFLIEARDVLLHFPINASKGYQNTVPKDSEKCGFNSAWTPTSFPKH